MRFLYRTVIGAGAAAAIALVIWLVREIGSGPDAFWLVAAVGAGAVWGALDAWLGS